MSFLTLCRRITPITNLQIGYTNSLKRRSLHTLRSCQISKLTKTTNNYSSSYFKRYQSTSTIPVINESSVTENNVTPDTLSDGYIPDIPEIPLEADLLAPILNTLGEPTLASLGLCNWSPAGLIQYAIENVHVTADLPWFASIMSVTLMLRLLVFPLIIKSQKNAANAHNTMPQVQKLQENFTKARMSGDQMKAAKAGQELMLFMKDNNVNPIKNIIVPMAQMPIFVSVFIGIRQMTSLPVESMSTGGALWFTDLTIPDPTYILPLITAATLALTFEVGVDGVRADSMSHVMKNVFRLMPLIMIPFIINFPSAMLCYWFTSNVFSLGQVLLLKIPSVKTYFKIPLLVKHEKSVLPKKKKFVEGFQETWSNSKVAAEMEQRSQNEMQRFRESGKGPITKTYSKDPTKKE